MKISKEDALMWFSFFASLPPIPRPDQPPKGAGAQITHEMQSAFLLAHTQEDLRACYLSCLDTAERAGLHSVAFCCISTGVFSFPRGEAAEIAVGTVLKWKMRHAESGLKIVFNTFLDADTEIYRNILKMM